MADRWRTGLVSVIALASLLAIGWVQFFVGRWLYGWATHRALDSLQDDQPVPGHVIDSNIFFGLIVPNMLAFCLYLAVFLLWGMALRRHPLRIYTALLVAAGATALVFLSYMAAGIIRYGS